MNNTINNVCRLCLNFGNNDTYQGNSNINIYIKVNKCLDIKIFPEDGLPKNICVICEQKVNDFYEFKEKCAKVNEELRLYKEASQNNNKISPTVKIKFEVFNEASQYYEINSSVKTELNSDDFFNADNIDDFCLKFNITPKKVAFKKKKNYTTKLFLQCEFCGQTFQRNSHMKLHMVKHASKKPYSCQICKQTFTRKDSQIVHSRIHSNERPFTCDTCGKSSRKKQDLIRHMRVHSDIKDYKCLLCDNRFRRAQDVKAHLRSHTGDKPFKCEKCVKCYSSYSALKKHCSTISCKKKT